MKNTRHCDSIEQATCRVLADAQAKVAQEMRRRFHLGGLDCGASQGALAMAYSTLRHAIDYQIGY